MYLWICLCRSDCFASIHISACTSNNIYVKCNFTLQPAISGYLVCASLTYGRPFLYLWANEGFKTEGKWKIEKKSSQQTSTFVFTANIANIYSPFEEVAWSIVMQATWHQHLNENIDGINGRMTRIHEANTSNIRPYILFAKISSVFISWAYRRKKTGKWNCIHFMCANDAQQCILFYFEHSFVARIFAYEKKNAKKRWK